MQPSTNTFSSINPSIEQREQLARFLWTGFIIMFFAIQAIIWMIAILMTSNDSSHAVVMGFDEKSNTTLSQVQRDEMNRTLGWTVTWTWPPIVDNQQNSQKLEFAIEVRDREGTPVNATSIEMSAFHCGQAARIQQIDLEIQTPGVYRGLLTIHKPGQWQIDAVLKRGEDVYYLSERISR